MMNSSDLTVEQIEATDAIKCDLCDAKIAAGSDAYMVEDFLPEIVGCSEEHAIEQAKFVLAESADARRFEESAYGSGE